MNVSDLNLKKIAAVALVTVVSLVAGSAAYAFLSVDRPVAQLLRSHPEVVSYRLVRANSAPAQVTVKLAAVDDLAKTYEGLHADVARLLSGSRLVVEDDRSPMLAVFMHETHFAVQEAAWSGGFVVMRARLEALAEASGIEVRVTVGPQRIYLVATAQNSYAYAVVERLASPPGRDESR